MPRCGTPNCDFPIAADQMNLTANSGPKLQLLSKYRVWMTASIDPLKSPHLPNHWLSTSPNSFNGLKWAAGIGRIGELVVFDARERDCLVLTYRSDGSKRAGERLGQNI
jgi:hypothetical protein